MTAVAHPLSPPSPWIERWSHLVRPGGEVLDVACGAGRHLQWFARRGHPVCGLDQDIGAAQALSGAQAQGSTQGFELIAADLERGPWPLGSGAARRQFAAVVVTHYLWRPLMDDIVQSLAPGGVLLYETFAAGNETVGRPARPDFLLQPGELLQACQHLHVVAYEHGFVATPQRYVQRIAAVRPALHTVTPAEIRGHVLSG